MESEVPREGKNLKPMKNNKIEVSINPIQLRRLDKAIRRDVLQPRFKRKEDEKYTIIINHQEKSNE